MTPDTLDATFAALADSTRRAILARLATGDAGTDRVADRDPYAGISSIRAPTLSVPIAPAGSAKALKSNSWIS